MCSKRDIVDGRLREEIEPTVWAAVGRRETPGRFPGRRGRGGIVLIALLAIGCGATGDATGPGPEADKAVAPAATAPAEPVEPTLQIVDHAGLMKEVASHLGKVVVLDCWSTSCPPCVKEFPGLVALAERHGDRVVCLSLAFDYDGSGEPDDLAEPILAFLRKVGAGRVVNLLSSEPADSLYRKLDLASVPAVYVWKPNGERAIRYDDDLAAGELGHPFTYDDVEKTVAALLAE